MLAEELKMTGQLRNSCVTFQWAVDREVEAPYLPWTLATSESVLNPGFDVKSAG
jgi:hypothetical protein